MATMDDERLEALLRREMGPVEASAGLRRRLASIPAASPQRPRKLAGLLDSTRLALAAGIATLAASLLLGIWIGSERAMIPAPDANGSEIAVMYQGVTAGLGDGS
jgi:hypothetical protein